MFDLKSFRKANKITQIQLAEYLGVNPSFIGNIETGRSILPKEKLNKILTNDLGWDASSFLKEAPSPSVTASASGGSTAKVSIDNSVKTVADIPPDVALLKAQIDSLTEQINLLKAELQRMRDEKDKYWEMIDRLTKK